MMNTRSLAQTLPDGLIAQPAAGDVPAVVGRLTEALAARGVQLFADIDHAAGARRVGLSLRPTRLLVFGDPRSGTPLMQARQTVGIDLPLKALVWQDADGTTWVGYTDPRWIAGRHRVGAHCPAVAAMTAAIENLLVRAN
ncbi:MAG TPA: DUF302 domain-containing protein [Humisphaera sp.]